ncbi:MAG: GNAT family N-acetyltransferase [Anaerolineaceae bacterium]|nr:GNAT family N-acetyltransferase [Anaerolineaceae bacterium]
MQRINRLAELIEDWKFLIRRDGMVRALPNIGQELGRMPYRHLRFVILERSLTLPLPEIPPKLALEIRPFRQEDVDLVREMDRPSEAILCARRFARGHLGLIALHQGRPVAYAWGCTEVDSRLERVHLHLEPGDVLCADVYTVPSYRGKGIQTSLTIARFKMFRDLGYRRAVTYIERRNSPSLAVWQRKLGSLTTGYVDFIRFAFWYRVRYLQNCPNPDLNDPPIQREENANQ